MATTQGQINSSREAVTALSAADRAAAEKKWQEANPGQTAAPAVITEQLYDEVYNRVLTQSGYGTGGSVQRLIQAGTAVAQGLSGGSVVSAVAGGMAPYLAEVRVWRGIQRWRAVRVRWREREARSWRVFCTAVQC